MSNLTTTKQLANKKNWSVDDLAQIIGYVMMGETTAYIADQLYFCELDVREVIQETLSELSTRSFHDHARVLGVLPKQDAPKPYNKRRFVRVPNPKPYKTVDVTPACFGDPPPVRSALHNRPESPSFKTLLNSIAIAPQKENTHDC